MRYAVIYHPLTKSPWGELRPSSKTETIPCKTIQEANGLFESASPAENARIVDNVSGKTIRS